MSLSGGDRLGRYEILGPLGAGGMGEVYRAHDERLDRDVAIKVLPEDVALDEARLERFEREARVVAKLAHPNVLEIWDFGTEGEITYSVAELLEGDNLRQRISSGVLSWQKAAEVAAAVAEGLAAAHGKGVIHRDLKPENIFITSDGRVKVLDFGLAKVQEQIPTEAKTGTLTPAGTEPGAIMGTVGYMAPEQVKGRPADARSDVFALGCVLYEMLAGRGAFERDTSAETIAAILKEDPPALSDAGWAVPAELERSVRRCLEKSPEARFQSASDLAYSLRSISTDRAIPTGPRVPEEKPPRRKSPWVSAGVMLATVTAIAGLWFLGVLEQSPPESDNTSIRSIALLPLANLTGDPEQEYLVDGLHEELIATLAQISAFHKVIARTSVMGFRYSDTPIREIGRQLGVEAVLEGSVRRSGDTVRITLQLIDSRDESRLWAGSFERHLSDVLALQSEVARAIADEVRLTLTEDEQNHLTSRRAVNEEAYRAYLRGVRLSRWGASDNDLDQARSFFQRAIELDSMYADAHFGLSYALFQIGRLYRNPNQYMPLACDYATKALRLDTGLADAHAVLGAIRLTWQWDWTGAEVNLRTAIELNPGNYIAAQQYAYYLIATGEQEKAISVMNRALELDPLNVRLMSGLGYIYCLSRRFTEGIEQAQTTLELHPEDPMANWVLTVNLFGAGRYEEASETIAGLFEVFPPLRRNGLFLAGLVTSQARAGNASQAKENLRELEELSRTQHVPPSSMAVTYLCLDDHDRAFDFLEKAVENHDTQLFHLVVSYLVDPVREDPRFEVILSRMNFPGT